MTSTSEQGTSLLRILLTLALLAFAIRHAHELLSTAFDIRGHALRTYGYIIHEVREPLSVSSL